MDPHMMDFEDFQDGRFRPNLGLILGGRGFFGLAALPVARRLAEMGEPIDLIAAASGGVLPAALIGAAPSQKRLDALLVDLSREPLVRREILPETVLAGLWRRTGGLFGRPDPKPELPSLSQPLHDKLSPILGRRRIEGLATKVLFEARDDATGETVAVAKGRALPLLLGAMADGRRLKPMGADGLTLREHAGKSPLPVQAALKYGATTLIAVLPETEGVAGKARRGLDRGELPHGVTVEVALPARMSPWDSTAIPEILAAGEAAADQAESAIRHLCRRALAA